MSAGHPAVQTGPAPKDARSSAPTSLAWAVGDGAPRRPLLEEQLKDSGPRACRTQACRSHRLPAPPAWIPSSRCERGRKRLSWKRLHWSPGQSRALQEGVSTQAGRSQGSGAAAVLEGEDGQRVGLKHPRGAGTRGLKTRVQRGG